jgi:integrase
MPLSPRPSHASRQPRSIPRMRHHKSGHAVVRLSGEDFWLGKFGTPESFSRYQQALSEWLARGCISRRRAAQPMQPAPRPTISTPDTIDVAEIVERFLQYAEGEFRREDGSPTGEADTIRNALRPLVNRHAATLAKDFTPDALDDVREAMIRDEDWCRNTINAHTRRIKAMFLWAKNKGLNASAYEAIRDVKNLKRGRTKARETEPKRPVPRPHIDQVLPFLSRHVAAMVQLQLLTGMRSSELCSLKAADLNMTGPTWRYEPARHKTAHLGPKRRIGLGARAQEILRPFLTGNPNEPIFRPCDANRERNEGRHVPHSPRAGRWKPQHGGKAYTRNTYRQAVVRACEKAFPPPAELARGQDETEIAWRARLTPKQAQELRAWRKAHAWHPHRLRHNTATEVTERFGVEAASAALGHSSARVTEEIYVERGWKAVERVMGEVG